MLDGASLVDQVKRKGLSVLVIQLCGLALSFGSHLLLARLLGAAEYGVYVYVFTWCVFLSVLAKFGFDSATLRFLPEYVAREELGLLKGFIVRRNQSVALLCVAGLLAMSLYAMLGSATSGQALGAAFLVGALSIPLSAFLRIHIATLRASLRSVASQLPLSIIRPALIGFGTFGAYLLVPDQLTGTVVVGIFVLSTGLVLIPAWWLAQSEVRIVVGNTRPAFETTSWCKTSALLMMPSTMLYAMNEMDILMVGSLLDTRSAGIYSVSARLATLVVVALNAVNVVVAPMISSLYHSGRMDELRALIRAVGRVICLLSVAIAAVLVLFSDQFLGLFGVGFLEGQSSLQILVAGQLFNALSGSVGFLLTMTGNHRAASFAIGVGVILGLSLNLLLIPRFGLEGAAVATSISMVFWNLTLAILVWQRLRINMYGFLSFSQG